MVTVWAVLLDEVDTAEQDSKGLLRDVRQCLERAGLRVRDLVADDCLGRKGSDRADDVLMAIELEHQHGEITSTAGVEAALRERFDVENSVSMTAYPTPRVAGSDERNLLLECPHCGRETTVPWDAACGHCRHCGKGVDADPVRTAKDEALEWYDGVVPQPLFLCG